MKEWTIGGVRLPESVTREAQEQADALGFSTEYTLGLAFELGMRQLKREAKCKRIEDAPQAKEAETVADKYAAELAEAMTDVHEVVYRASAEGLTVGEILNTEDFLLSRELGFTECRPDDLFLPRHASEAINAAADAMGRDPDMLLSLATPALLERVEQLRVGEDTDSAPDGTTCEITPLPLGLARLDITMPNDSPTLAKLRKLADHAGVTVDQYVAAKLTQAALEASKAKEPLTLPADVAATFREVAAILGRDPQSWTTGFLRAMAADLADVESGLLRDEVDACGADPDVMRRFRAYCKRRSGQIADGRRAQRKAA